MESNTHVVKAILELVAGNAAVEELRAAARGELNLSMFAAKLAEFGERVPGSSKRSVTWAVKDDRLILTLHNGKAKQFATHKASANRDEFSTMVTECLRRKISVPSDFFAGSRWDTFGVHLKEKQSPRATRPIELKTAWPSGGGLAARA